MQGFYRSLLVLQLYFRIQYVQLLVVHQDHLDHQDNQMIRQGN